MSTESPGVTRSRWAILLPIASAALITTTDGFDAFSLSLTAPQFSAELHIPTAALGGIFASGMAGMIVGGLAGSALADKFGRLRTMFVALALIAGASFSMLLVTNQTEIMLNRFVAGLGLGSAAPIAVALLLASSARPVSPFSVTIVWASIAFGGVLASAFSYLFAHNWRAIFVAGGVLPIVAGIVASVVFRQQSAESRSDQPVAPSQLGGLFSRESARFTIATGTMFFFGYVTSSLIVNWLPTILSKRGASQLLISLSFGSVSVGAILGSLGLGLIATRFRSHRTLSAAWLAAALCAASAMPPMLDNASLAFAALAAEMLAVGSQTLAVAFVSRNRRFAGLECTAIGLMTSTGRLGQFSALACSGFLIHHGLAPTGLFGVAGGCALISAAITLFLVREEAISHQVKPPATA